MPQPDRYQQIKRITLWGAFINVFLGCIKVLSGFLFHSHALIADGIHSFSDVITDIMVVFASKYGNQDADESHPYGHQRIETVATLMLAVLLLLAGLGIVWDAFNELLHTIPTKPAWYALVIALFSILANELSFRYTYHVGKQVQSNLLIANAWHHRSDAASSIIVALGLIGSLVGLVYLDVIAAIIVGLMIIKICISYGWNSIKELVDAAVEPSTLKQIEQIIQDIPGVERIHQLRSRLMGGEILIDVHVLVAPYISVSEGHYIAQQVHYKLINQLERIKDVVVHIDPEDDELSQPSVHLPARQLLEQQLLLIWQKDFPIIEEWILHYLNGQITIDLICQEDKLQLAALRQRINEDLRLSDDIKQVRFFIKESLL